jgi:hypothetical protein
MQKQLPKGARGNGVTPARLAPGPGTTRVIAPPPVKAGPGMNVATGHGGLTECGTDV